MNWKNMASVFGLVAGIAGAQVITPLTTEHEGKTGLKDLVVVVNQNMTNLAAAINAGTNATILSVTTITTATIRATTSSTTVTARATAVYGGAITSEGGVTGVTAVFSTSATSATVRAANVYGGTITSEGTVTGAVVRGATLGAGSATIETALSVKEQAAGNVVSSYQATNMPTDCISTGDAPAWLRINITGSTNLYVVPAYRISGP